MTTFTSDDREEAPNQPGYEDAVPIPFAGWVKSSPPHIVDSGASVMGMSANELAVYLEDITDWEESPYRQAATMLRQQQAQIEMLKKAFETACDGMETSLKLNKAQAERNNEPVIWTACLDCGKRVTGDSIHTCSPQLKQLTDEEILQFQDKVPYTLGSDLIEFARAILRKAQEK
jgi:hypothetical protein